MSISDTRITRATTILGFVKRRRLLRRSRLNPSNIWQPGRVATEAQKLVLFPKGGEPKRQASLGVVCNQIALQGRPMNVKTIPAALLTSEQVPICYAVAVIPL